MLLSTLVAAGAVYAALCLGLFLGQHRLVYFPERELAATPDAVGLAYSERWITAEDGVRLHAWWVPGPPDGGEAAPAVLFLHGNAGNISHRLETVELLHRLGAGVLMLEYRGYGLSAGSPGEEGTYRDARAAHEHLTGPLGVAPERLVVMGRSLGGGVATRLATERPCAGLIVESSFTSVPDLAAAIYPLFPVRLLARIRYDSLSRIGDARCPVLIVHSRDDELVPFGHAQRLLDAAAPGRRLLAIRGGHNDGFLASGALYRDGIAHFLESLGLRVASRAP